LLAMKKQPKPAADTRRPAAPKPVKRPVGMQAMRPALYAQLRLAMLELALAR
jgi:hypothetical protein